MRFAALPLLVAAAAPPHADVGKAEGRCRLNEAGPALMVRVEGLKDRHGNLKLEVYPANDRDFLADDFTLVSAGKVFRRVEAPVSASSRVELCIRVPGPGTYSVSLLHDRDGDRKFDWPNDGIGFAGNPKLGFSKPKAAAAAVTAGAGLTHLTIVLNYHHGLGMAPLRKV